MINVTATIKEHVCSSPGPRGPVDRGHTNRLMQLPPAPALHSVLRQSGLPEKKAARAASKELRDAAGIAVATLQAQDGQLPARAWAVFGSADGLHVARVPIPWGGGADVAARLVELMAQLPGRRVQRLCVENQQDLAAAGARRACAALAASAAAAGLQQLTWSWPLPCLEVEALLRRTAQLRRLSLTCNGGLPRGAAWLPALPPGLTSLGLACAYDSDTAPHLDLAALRGLSRLQQLELASLYTSNPGSLAALRDLRGLALLECRDWSELRAMSGRAPCLAGASQLAPLTRLTRLVYTEPLAGRGPWQLLCQLPALQELETPELRIDLQPPGGAALAALTALTSLTCGLALVGCTPPPGAAAPPGARGELCAALPALRRLDASAVECAPAALALALSGHPCLRRLRLRGAGGTEHDWLLPAFSSLPILEELALQDRLWNADSLLGDVAACGSLRSLRSLHLARSGRLSDPRQAITAAGLGALARCAARLRSLRLETTGRWHYDEASRVGPEEALPLLLAPMPGLQELELPLRRLAPEQLDQLARQLGRPVALLRQQLMQIWRE